MNGCNENTLALKDKRDGSIKLMTTSCQDTEGCSNCASSYVNGLKSSFEYVTQTLKLNNFACLTADPKRPNDILDDANAIERDLSRLNIHGFELDCAIRRVKFRKEDYDAYCKKIIELDVLVQLRRYERKISKDKKYTANLGQKERDKKIQDFRVNSLKKLKDIQESPYGWLFIRVGELQKNGRIHFHYLCNGWLDGVVVSLFADRIYSNKSFSTDSYDSVREIIGYVSKYMLKELEYTGYFNSWKDKGYVIQIEDGKEKKQRVDQIKSSAVFTRDSGICPICEWIDARKEYLSKENQDKDKTVQRLRLITFAKVELHIDELHGEYAIMPIDDDMAKSSSVPVTDNYKINALYAPNPRQKFTSEEELRMMMFQFSPANTPLYQEINEQRWKTFRRERQKSHLWEKEYRRMHQPKSDMSREEKRHFNQVVEEKLKEVKLLPQKELTQTFNHGTDAICAVISKLYLNKFKFAILPRRVWTVPGLTPEQSNFVDAFTQHGTLMLDGAAGTGKTYAMAALMKSYDFTNKKVLFTSVSSQAVTVSKKALERLSVTTDKIDYKNIYVALNAVVNNYFFSYVIPHDTLEYDVIIVDEISMMSIQQLCGLLASAKKGTRLVFCGDFCQLPPVGSGYSALSFLLDMNLPVHHLTKNMRSNFDVLDFANAIRNSDPRLKQYIEAHTKPMDELWKLGKDYQILSNTHSEISSIAAHTGIVPDFISDGSCYNVGCDCLANKNIANKNVLNGTAMRLVKYNSRSHRAMFELSDGRRIELPINAEYFITAQAITVHKSQGNEYRKVAIVIKSKSIGMCNKNWLYTAVTRAKEEVLIFFDNADCKSQKNPIDVLAGARFIEGSHFTDYEADGVERLMLHIDNPMINQTDDIKAQIQELQAFLQPSAPNISVSKPFKLADFTETEVEQLVIDEKRPA